MRTLPELLEHAAEAWPDRLFLVDHHGGLTFRDFRDLVHRTVGGLDHLGIGPGLRLAVWLENRAEWLAAQFAVGYLGASVVAVNTRLRDDDLGFVLADSAAHAILIGKPRGDVDFLRIVDRVAPAWRDADRVTTPVPQLSQVITVGGGDGVGTAPFDRLVDHVAGGTPVIRCTPQDEANLLYTSGTTSRPRGAIRTHGNYLPHLVEVGRRLGLGVGDVVHVAFPLCGATGVNIAAAAMSAGAGVVLTTNTDPDIVIPLLQRASCTYLATMDSVLLPWLDSHASALGALPLRGGFIAKIGTEDGRELVSRLEKTLGVPFVQPYGLTETNAAVLCAHPGDPLEVRAEIGGPPVPPAEVTVLDPDTGDEAEEGAIGEIVVRGGTVVPGYLGSDDAVLDDHGWFRTGDLGTRGARGSVSFASRAKDVLKVSGFMVGPAEIESMLTSHPEVELAAVVGYHLPGRGEVPVAFVRRTPGSSSTEQELQTYCRTRTARYKVPWRILDLEDFPQARGPHGGKVQRARLRSLAVDILGERT